MKATVAGAAALCLVVFTLSKGAAFEAEPLKSASPLVTPVVVFGADQRATLEDFAAKLTIREPNGAIKQMGFLPWLPWDNSYMWGVLFGGQWYNEKTGLIDCATDPAIIRMFEWQLSFTRGPDPSKDKPFAMDPDMVTSFSKGLGEYMSANNPFYAGRVAMMVEGEW